jgi:RNA polymerase sigma factor (sigma-70 family)
VTGFDTSRRLTEWFLQWRSPLRKFLIGQRSVPAADVNDVAQEVFLRLLRYERSEFLQHPQAYLFKMAANVANEWAIRARSSRPHEAKWLADLLSEDCPEDEAARAEACAEIARALGTLTPRQRAVLKLHFGEGLAREAIAARLGTTPRVIKRDLLQSYEKLRAELDSELLWVLTNGRE